ncbi:hypothetical protein ACROYT_G000554 [Oculina patagonica]
MEASKSTEKMMIDDSSNIKFGRGPSKERILTLVVLAVGIIFLIVGIVLIAMAAADKKSVEKSTGGTSKQGGQEEQTTASVPPTTMRVSTSTLAPTATPGPCNYSDEAQRVGLDEFLRKVKTTYYKMNPNNAVYDPDSTPTTIRQDFSPYNAHPNAIRARTDAARALYDEAQELDKKVDSAKMKPREIKAIAQVKHFLQSNFGAPYDENYYAGDWMLGPNKFCWQPICSVGYDIKAHFTYKSWGIRPKTVDDVNFVINHLKRLNDSLMQYIENVKYGVKAGFVRPEEDCQDGLYSIQRRCSCAPDVFRFASRLAFRLICVRPRLSIGGQLYSGQLGPVPTVSVLRELTVVVFNSSGPRLGVLNESYTQEMLDPKWLADLQKDAAEAWQKEHKESVRISINDALVEYVGKPLDSLLKYLEFNHSQYCVPSNISSGLATLPLKYIYKNGNNTGVKTTGKLPSGEPLNGTKAYEMILPYFTTNQMTPDQVYDLGEKMLNQLYPRAVEIAKKITGKQDENQAVELFKKRLEEQSMFFNDEKIPENESNKDAFAKCTSMEQAKIYCPKRYKAMLTWFEYVKSVLSDLAPKTNHMFHFTGKRQSTPNCPVLLVANFNPGTGSQSYQSSNKDCTRNARYRLPFYLKDMGPRYNAISVGAHEARPGHHTQVQGFTELFGDSCGGVISWLNGASYYTAFTEGWALYAENPLIAEETDTYKDNPLQLYGMLKWQIWRALRLMMDTGLHYKGMKRWEALKLFADKAWDKTDKAVKDVTRYQSVPGQATAYMIGQLKIWQVRNDTQAKIEGDNKEFSEKDFHYQVLSQGIFTAELSRKSSKEVC